MNNLVNILNKDGQLVVTSRQVSKDFDKYHKHVLASIDNLMSQMSSAENSSQYFIQDSYKDDSGKSNREYLLTRDGFSLLVMGFTGSKALVWKLKYIEAFNKMEQILKGQARRLSTEEILELQYKYTKEVKKEVNELKEDFYDFKDNAPLFNVECKELQSLVRKTGIRVLGGYRSPAYNNNSLRGKVYADIQHQLKREFGVSRYEAIKRSQLETATRIVGNYTVPTVLGEEIQALNNQLALKEVM